jgi:ubiquinone/menaquinone biosynthesis C-methylase UbiE
MTVSYQRYDRLAANYDKAIGPLERWFLHRLRQEAISALPVGGRVLELGAGTGLNFSLYERTLNGVATEPSTEMLRIAATKPKPDTLQLVQSCAERLPFESGSFDAALATLVICSVQSPEQVFAELRRVVRPGGTISLLEHVRPDGLLGPLFDLLNLLTVPLADDHFNRQTCELARRSGLKITNVRKVGLGIINVITCLV